MEVLANGSGFGDAGGGTDAGCGPVSSDGEVGNDGEDAHGEDQEGSRASVGLCRRYGWLSYGICQ